ncbi:MAG TPA: ATP-binding protein [Caldisericia bacterium]|nr:ATP-binding protein [Caldisericia bacterium]HRT37574.1 ATP-binding protein [Caldisericia bacterium]
MKFKKEIPKRLIITSLLTILIPIILIVAITFFYLRDSSIKIYESNLVEIAYMLEPTIKEKFLSDDEIKIDEYVKSLKSEKEFRLTIIKPDGSVIADSILDPTLMENHKSREEIIEALNGQIGKSIRYSSSTKEDMLYISLPVYDSFNNIISIIRVSLSLKELNSLINRTILNIVLISLIGLSIGLILSFYYSRYFLSNINEIKNFLKELSKKNYGKKIIIKKQDEFGEIAQYLNVLSSELEENIKSYDKEKAEINTILSSIEEGVLVINSDGLITLCNQVFEDIIKEIDIINKYYWEVVKNIEIVDFIKNILKTKEIQKKEIYIKNKNYLIKGFYLKTINEFVFTFFDTSSIKKIEEVKRDFVRDASHELKTPLTAIKGFVETLEEEVEEKKYIEIIKRNVDRMINIINDLITLSKLEDKDVVLEISEFDFIEMINNVIKIFSNKIKERNLKIKIDTDNYNTKIKGDPYKLEQVFINLIDNAIKYTEEGGININYYLKEDNAVIEIIDTGIGIPEEHLDRIFERFYVVNKSRSKELGGTGLGLSIVKHIITLHNGKIEVESEVGKGSKFIITIPQ